MSAFRIPGLLPLCVCAAFDYRMSTKKRYYIHTEQYIGCITYIYTKKNRGEQFYLLLYSPYVTLLRDRVTENEFIIIIYNTNLRGGSGNRFCTETGVGRTQICFGLKGREVHKKARFCTQLVSICGHGRIKSTQKCTFRCNRMACVCY
jgi:hypothetical protein